MSGNTPKSSPVAINNPHKARSSIDEDDATETISAKLYSSSKENGSEMLKGLDEGDPDSPTSQALVRAARRTLEEAEACSTPERRFNFLHDIARNPRLAEAARLELELDGISGHSSPRGLLSSRSMGSASGQTNTAAQTAGAGSVTYFAHSNEVERQTALIKELDAEAVQESKINQGMSSVMLGRLSSGKAAAERILSVLQAFASAEAAYARAMDALARVALPGEADGGTMRLAMCEFSALPAALSSLHSGVSEALAPVIRAVQAVVVELRAASEEISAGARAAQKNVDNARKGMKDALTAHRDACKAFDATLDRNSAGGSRSRPVEADPWIAEGRLVEKQASLQSAQVHQRRYLAGAFRRAGELERRRIEITCTALTALMELPRTTSLPEVATAYENLSAALSVVDREGDLEAFSAVAQNSVRNGDALSSRQAELVDHLWAELNTSAEIVRQGEIQRFDPGKDNWIRGYGVLTRAGFLHWFVATGRNEEGTGAWTPHGGPISSLNLARCEFEQGYAPAWRLIDVGSGGFNSWLGGGRTSLSLRTTGVEECMDWAADLRELISACTNK